MRQATLNRPSTPTPTPTVNETTLFPLSGPVIGLRAKTARAIAVVLGEAAHVPVALRRVELTFATPRTPATFQPYHEVMDLPWERAQVVARKVESALVATAADALSQLVDQAIGDWGRVCSVAIVGAPDRKLEAIASPHIRAHAAEGVLFRRILERAAEQIGLAWHTYAERGLEELAVQELRTTSAALQDTLSQFGRTVGRPWRADEKAAALGAWLALAGRE